MDDNKNNMDDLKRNNMNDVNILDQKVGYLAWLRQYGNRENG